MAAIDYYNTDDDFQQPANGNSWLAQTFTASSSYSISSVSLKLYRTSTPGLITVGIRAVDVDSKPTGADLASGTTDGDTLPTGSPYEWRTITFAAPYALSSGTKYAVVMRCVGGTGKSVSWRFDSSGSSYSGGTFCSSTNAGSSWSVSSSYDFMFETYGVTIHEVSGAAAIVAGQSGNLTGMFLLSGPVAAVFGLSSFLSSNIFVGSVLPITMAMNAPRLFKLFKTDHTVPIRRLIAAGNNQIWYEVI